MSLVSSDDIQRARRIALRVRSAMACLPCKEAKSKCNDYRPCSRCKKLSQTARCVDQVSIIFFYLGNDDASRTIYFFFDLMECMHFQINDNALAGRWTANCLGRGPAWHHFCPTKPSNPLPVNNMHLNIVFTAPLNTRHESRFTDGSISIR